MRVDEASHGEGPMGAEDLSTSSRCPLLLGAPCSRLNSSADARSFSCAASPAFYG